MIIRRQGMTAVYLTVEEMRVVADACIEYGGVCPEPRHRVDRRAQDVSLDIAQDISRGLRRALAESRGE